MAGVVDECRPESESRSLAIGELSGRDRRLMEDLRDRLRVVDGHREAQLLRDQLALALQEKGKLQREVMKLREEVMDLERKMLAGAVDKGRVNTIEAMGEAEAECARLREALAASERRWSHLRTLVDR